LHGMQQNIPASHHIKPSLTPHFLQNCRQSAVT
jgi:hypothetical protein